MNNKKILEDVYHDFFNNSNINIKNEEKNEDLVELQTNLIDDDSINMINNIVNYMSEFNQNKQDKYLTFNIFINSNNNELINNINEYLFYYSNKYNYIDNKSKIDISLIKLEDENKLDNIYKENGFIYINDLNLFNLFDIKNKKKFINNFKKLLFDKKITILSGSNDDYNNFTNEYNTFKNDFCFLINEKKVDYNYIYNKVLESVEVSDDKKLNLLDYITNTYKNDILDNYINNLIKYISFHKDIPEYNNKLTNEEVFGELNNLVGLEKVKKTFYELVDLISLKNKTKEELKINNINLHMVFLGNPGTGKTTVARLIKDILFNLGYINENKLIEVTSKDLIAEYVGQTTIKTNDVLEKAKGGVLFIDEAYTLGDNKANSYASEAVATIIKYMEDNKDDIVLIFAGYTKETDQFLNSNSGIISRIGYTLEFDDYTREELLEIFKSMAKKSNFILDKNIDEKILKIIDENINNKNFGNARFIRNMFEKTIIKHASNTKNIKDINILKTITKDDITI